jgi:quinol monooxygenase YgiN
VRLNECNEQTYESVASHEAARQEDKCSKGRNHVRCSRRTIVRRAAGSLDWRQMIIEQLGISAPDGQRLELGSGLASLVGPTHVQRGCLGCRLFQNWQEPDELLIEATWETEEDLVRHLQSDTYKRLLLLMELSSAPPVLKFCTVDSVSGLELVKRARRAAGVDDTC